MSRRLEISFQIDEEVLSRAVIRLGDILGDLDADAMVDEENPTPEGETSTEKELRVLLDKVSDTQCRFPVEPGDEDGDDDE